MDRLIASFRANGIDGEEQEFPDLKVLQMGLRVRATPAATLTGEAGALRLPEDRRRSA